MAYTPAQMLYSYKWQAAAASDNPYYTRGTDHSEINKSEGYEVLYFLNHLARIFWPNQPDQNLATYQKMERILMEHVPPRSTHKRAEDFIRTNWSNYNF